MSGIKMTKFSIIFFYLDLFILFLTLIKLLRVKILDKNPN